MSRRDEDEPVRTGKRASITTQRSEFADEPQSISEEEEFIAINAGRTVKSVSPIDGEGGGLTGSEKPGVVKHTRPGMVTMMKPLRESNDTPIVGWGQRTVPATMIQNNLIAGWKVYCPDCGAGRPGKSWHGDLPNDCPGREPTKLRRCPIATCPYVAWDNLPVGVTKPSTDDPNEIVEDAYVNSTPELRTRIALNRHGWAKHPREWEEMGFTPGPGDFDGQPAAGFVPMTQAEA